jgi:hypothetical protein
MDEDEINRRAKLHARRSPSKVVPRMGAMLSGSEYVSFRKDGRTADEYRFKKSGERREGGWKSSLGKVSFALHLTHTPKFHALVIVLGSRKWNLYLNRK